MSKSDDLISRRAAIDALGEAPEVWMDTPEEFASLNQWEMDVTAIEAVPSVERPKGHWESKEVLSNADGEVIEEWQSARCSNCGRYHTTPYMYYFNKYNYCPNCGADMRGEQE